MARLDRALPPPWVGVPDHHRPVPSFAIRSKVTNLPFGAIGADQNNAPAAIVLTARRICGFEVRVVVHIGKYAPLCRSGKVKTSATIKLTHYPGLNNRTRPTAIMRNTNIQWIDNFPEDHLVGLGINHLTIMRRAASTTFNFARNDSIAQKADITVPVGINRPDVVNWVKIVHNCSSTMLQVERARPTAA
jgi:hypothetical protein